MENKINEAKIKLAVECVTSIISNGSKIASTMLDHYQETGVLDKAVSIISPIVAESFIIMEEASNRVIALVESKKEVLENLGAEIKAVERAFPLQHPIDSARIANWGRKFKYSLNKLNEIIDPKPVKKEKSCASSMA